DDSPIDENFAQFLLLLSHGDLLKRGILAGTTNSFYASHGPGFCRGRSSLKCSPVRNLVGRCASRRGAIVPCNRPRGQGILAPAKGESRKVYRTFDGNAAPADTISRVMRITLLFPILLALGSAALGGD